MKKILLAMLVVALCASCASKKEVARTKVTRGVKIAWEAELMRHFTVKLERL